jgi:hypothetical protein
MADRLKIADLLRSFVELFVNGKLRKPIWKFLSTAIMTLFHKLAEMKRDLIKNPRVRPITIGALICRFSVRAIHEEERHCIASSTFHPVFIRYNGKLLDDHFGVHSRIVVQP